MRPTLTHFWLLAAGAAALAPRHDRCGAMHQVSHDRRHALHQFSVAAATAVVAPRAYAKPPPTLQGAYASFNAGRYDEALTAFEALTAADANDATAWEGKGTVELILGSQRATLVELAST